MVWRLVGSPLERGGGVCSFEMCNDDACRTHPCHYNVSAPSQEGNLFGLHYFVLIEFTVECG